MIDRVVVLLILDLHQQHLEPEYPTKCFNVTIENNIAHVILNRPDKRNSMNADFGVNYLKSSKTSTVAQGHG